MKKLALAHTFVLQREKLPKSWSKEEAPIVLAHVRTDRALHTPRTKGPSRTKRAEPNAKRSIKMIKLLSRRSIRGVTLRRHPLEPEVNVAFLFKVD